MRGICLSDYPEIPDRQGGCVFCVGVAGLDDVYVASQGKGRFDASSPHVIRSKFGEQSVSHEDGTLAGQLAQWISAFLGGVPRWEGEDVGVWFVTGTFDLRDRRGNQLQPWTAPGRQFGRKSVVRYLEGLGAELLGAVVTEELGKVGLRLHYHGVLVCSARVGQQLLEDSWRWGWSVISQARSFGDVVAYVAKYTVKDVVQEVGSGLPSWFDIRGEAKGTRNINPAGDRLREVAGLVKRPGRSKRSGGVAVSRDSVRRRLIALGYYVKGGEVYHDTAGGSPVPLSEPELRDLVAQVANGDLMLIPQVLANAEESEDQAFGGVDSVMREPLS